jgi:glutamate/aspartate transport system substrate-binding protein
MTAGRLLVALVLAAAAGVAQGQDARVDPGELGPRMQAIRKSGAVRIGYREHALPFSYLARAGEPVGYSIDLCRAVVDTLARDLDRDLVVRFVKVTPEDRLAKVASGAVDLECGATTNTVERSRQVAFSPVIFITGTRLAVPRASAIRGVADLKGRRVAIVAGTTAEAVMRDFDRLLALGITVVPVPNYADALAAAADGAVHAVAADDVLLRGVLAETKRAADFRVVGDLLSFEPYGIAFPRDDAALADAVARTISRLAETREIAWIYDRWFVRPLPSGQRMDLPMSPQLRRALELIGLPTD